MQWPMYMDVAGLLLIMVCNRLFSEGMFMDGLYYADVALNMAEDNGDFWHPQFTDIQPFYGHPPLAMWMESMMYRLFGDSIAIEKIYSMLVTVLSLWLTVRLWRQCGGKRELGWLPLLLFALIPTLTACMADNMLENTMMVFTLLSVIFMLRGEERHHYINMIASGIALAAAFLTKGFTGLYPLVFPMVIWLTFRNKSFAKAVADTLIVCATFAVIMCSLLLLCPDAKEFFRIYFGIQVLDGVKVQVIDSRFSIVVKFFERSAVTLVVAVLTLFIAWRRQKRDEGERLWSKSDGRHAAALMILVGVGVLPIMVSMKQRAFYILTVYPFLSIALSLLMQDSIEKWIGKAGEKILKICYILAFMLVAGGVTASVIQIGKPSHYDPEEIADMKIIIPHVKPHSIVGIEESMVQQWSLGALYYRWGRVNLDNAVHDTMLLRSDVAEHWLEANSEKNYKKLELPTDKYHLYVSDKGF